MAYTEFYCQNGGSNINAGSTNSNTPIKTYTHGNWTQSTGVFTVTDGTNPSLSISVGDWVAVMVDGATVAASISRVSAVQNANNGTITANTNVVGTKPANQTGTATLVDGGAFRGPNGASGFPFTLTNWGNNKDSTAHMVRCNLKNDQTYSMTAGISISAGTTHEIEGYSSSTGDNGKATIDGGTSTATVIAAGGTGTTFKNIIFKTSFGSGSNNLVTTAQTAVTFLRCVFTGSRNAALAVSTANCHVYESEFYSNPTGIFASAATDIFRCFIHDGTNGISLTTGGMTVRQCVIANHSAIGLGISGTSNSGSIIINNVDFYNNTSDAIQVATGNVNHIWIENCNFIKNNGAAINNISVVNAGYVYNCGYGAGTQANGSADTLNNLSQSGTVTYASNVTPYNAPTTGDFTNILPAAQGVGRGHFEENDGTNTGTVGYPDIGAAQAQVTATTYRKSSHVFCG